VASELVSNVVQHTEEGGIVEAWDPKPDVPFRLEVSDCDPSLPLSPGVATDEGGRGLHIVDDVAGEWGVIQRRGGKTVWAHFDRSAPDGQKPDGDDPDSPSQGE
jgi:anti-sigma regulatory factor (Ser/Thr protein kinase)